MMKVTGGLETTRRLKRLLSNRPLADALFSSAFGRRVRKWLYRFPASEVERIGAALDLAGVSWWLAGGWGVDALIGRQSRHHGDLDLCVEVASDGEARAVAVLGALGYELTVRRAPSGHQFPFRSVLRGSNGRTVDLILVTRLDTSPTDEDVPVLGAADCTHGQVEVGEGSVAAPCLSSAFQVALHAGYVPQERDRTDIALLCDAFDLPVPPIYQREPARLSFAEWMHSRGWAVITRFRGISAVVVLIPEADEIRSAVGGSSGTMPAHVTITYPFTSPRRIGRRHHEQLGEIAASTPPFRVDLAALDHHETHTFLTVSPEEPLRRLAAEVLEAWPEHPRYGDTNLDVPPHVTIAVDVFPEEIADSVEPFLPVEVTVDRLALMTRGLSGRWRLAGEFPFRRAVRAGCDDGV
jgi:lincosamide nucleotidyltransferase A/C/D/E